MVVNETKTVVENSDVSLRDMECLLKTRLTLEQLNHSIQLSADGTTLYASTSDNVYRWPYDAVAGTVGCNETLVTNMSNTDVSISWGRGLFLS